MIMIHSTPATVDHRVLVARSPALDHPRSLSRVKE